jgi:transcriptional regulator with XRE-family HTH domain
MKGAVVKKSRLEAGLTQVDLAKRLGVTQAYLSLLESGKRDVSDRIARSVARCLVLPATALPLPQQSVFDMAPAESWVEQGLSRLGYPGFAYRRKRGATPNPSELLLRSLALKDLDPRLVEGLPWLLLTFEGIDFSTLATLAKLRDLQNRLGFTVALARKVAERNTRYKHRLVSLRSFEKVLDLSRLARENTFGCTRMSDRMRCWLRENRSKTAAHWNLLTDLMPEHLPYAS